MKKIVKVLLLAIAVLALFVGCTKCPSCGSLKVKKESITRLGITSEAKVCQNCGFIFDGSISTK